MPSDIQPQLLRRMTVRRILETLQSQGPSSRAELTRSSGISAPTVSKAVASLLEQGLLEEGEAPSATLGRPGRVLRLASERAQVLGVVLDATQCTVVAAGLDGRVEQTRTYSFLTPSTYSQLIDEIAERVEDLTASNGMATLGVGISVPGLINRRTQQALFSPNLHITDRQTPSRDLEERTGLSAVILQETHCLCLSERMLGGAQGLEDFAMLDVSTGLGLGVVSSGQLLSGHSGLAGELGHITMQPDGRVCGCGNRGCLETLATDSAFVQRLSKKVGQAIPFDKATDCAASHTIEFESALDETCEYLSIAMAAAINLFNPQTLFVHGRMFELRDDLFASVVETTRQRTLKPSHEDCRIVQARGSKRQGAIAGMIHHLTDSLGPHVG